MSLNNIYIYPILVSMESILTNCNLNKTFITFHILCSPDTTEITLSKLKILIFRYFGNLEIIIYSMGNNFYYRSSKYLPQVTFYRLLIPIIIDVDRIIYLDGDTMTFEDLYDLYNIDFKDNYILGFLGIKSFGLDYLGIKSKTYINVGVILLNLKKIRKDKKHIDLLNITKSNIELKNDDNTVLNYALYPKIGRLPIKYGIWNYGNKLDIILYSKRLRQKINITEFEKALKRPGIIHNVLCSPKPWFTQSHYVGRYTSCKPPKLCKCTKYHNLWHFFAKKTGYYIEILNYIGEKSLYKNIN